jgi:acyl-CoA thioester hydrolase
MTRPAIATRAAYRWFHPISTRWMDNDVYGHVNNAIYFSYFDTAVSGFEVAHKLVDYAASEHVFVVVEAHCRYHGAIAFPDSVTVGIRCGHLGRTSARYECGVFRNDEERASAEGHFVHVYVERASMRPEPIPADVRAILATITVTD